MSTPRTSRRQADACAGCAAVRHDLDGLRVMVRDLARAVTLGSLSRCTCGELATRRTSTSHPWPAHERPAFDACAPNAPELPQADIARAIAAAIAED